MIEKGPPWFDAVMGEQAPDKAWKALFGWLADFVRTQPDPSLLQRTTGAVDRLLAEAAWARWERFADLNLRTAQRLRYWWEEGEGRRAVLILDSLSLREVRWLLQGAARRGVGPLRVSITASEVPSDTDHFARALGARGRHAFDGPRRPRHLILRSDRMHTAVLRAPFDQCRHEVKKGYDLILWHTWLDDLIHLYRRSPAQVATAAERDLLSDAFWELVAALRLGRRLVITADHGYAVSELFAVEESERDVRERLAATFGAARHAPASMELPPRLLQPIAITHQQQHVIIGQRRWKLPGGYPHLCHGGLSLLEVAVPFVEIPEGAL